jgi:magnesium transporter
VMDLIPRELITARAYTDQEKVAFLALRYNLKAIPVVDKNNRFLGVVASDDILRILDNEAIEDILSFGGVWHRGPYDDIFNIPLLRSIKHRLPWLILGLLGGILAAGIINRFEGILAQNLILAAFIPLIVYMADAVGTQMEAFLIRDLAIMPKMRFLKYFLRQISVVFVIALIIAGLLIIVISAIYGERQIALTVGAAIFLAILSSVLTGLVVPYLFNKFKFDPANTSGPIATIIQDILSVFVYFLIANLLL